MHRTLNLFRRPLAAAMVIAALASPALSEDFTESHIAAARDTIAAAHASEQFNEILLALAEQTKALIQRSNPGAAKDLEEVVSSVALDLAKRRPDLDRELERVWAGRFSEDELKQITAFFNSPEYTRMKISLPTKGSVATLNASAHSGSKSLVVRSSPSSVLG